MISDECSVTDVEFKSSQNFPIVAQKEFTDFIIEKSHFSK